MDTALTQKFPFILDRNLAKANSTENHVCMSCDTVVLGTDITLVECTISEQSLHNIRYLHQQFFSY